MIDHAHPTHPSAAASFHGAASPSLELGEARQLRDALKALLRKEQAAMADFLQALAGFDRRRGWEPLGHASFFAFLHFELGLSNSAAFHRMSAARLLQRFPDLAATIRDGRLCLSTTAELAKVATDENWTEVAPRFFGLSAREAQEVVAELQPRANPPLRAVVTSVAGSCLDAGPTVATLARPVALPGPSASSASRAATTSTDPGSLLTSEEELTHPARGAALRDAPRDGVEPLTADLRRLHVTVSRQLLKKLDAARDGLSHAVPGATTEQVIEAALDLLLEKQARARGLVKRPRSAAMVPVEGVSLPSKPTQPAPGPAVASGNATEEPCANLAKPEAEPEEGPEPFHRRSGPRETIPAAVRRAVWDRDGGRCSWPLDSGGACGSAHRLELDHVVPWALGGESTVANLRIVCNRHNRLAARRAFGERCVGRYAGQRAGKGAA